MMIFYVLIHYHLCVRVCRREQVCFIVQRSHITHTSSYFLEAIPLQQSKYWGSSYTWDQKYVPRLLPEASIN